MVSRIKQQLHGMTLHELICEGQGGTPAEQMRFVLNELQRECSALGGTMSDLVFARFWMRSRAQGEEARAVRRELLDQHIKICTSSFYDAAVFAGNGDIRVEALFCVPGLRHDRKTIEFNPPRRYLHYLAQSNGLFTSGMAEPGATTAVQADACIDLLAQALVAEQMTWHDVLFIQVFIERGQCDDPETIFEKLNQCCDLANVMVSVMDVDGLASVDKHLEIEIIAAKA